MPIPDFALKVELDTGLDGLFATDITGFVYGGSIIRGREDALTKIQAGQMQLTVSNRDGRFSPDKGTISGLDSFMPIRAYNVWTTPAVTNLVDNPSLETNLDGWAGSVALVLDTTHSRFGKQSALLNAGAGADSISINDVGGTRFSVTAGLNYILRPRLQLEGAANSVWKVGVSWFNSGGSLIQTDFGATQTLTPNGPWTEFLFSGVAPVGAVTALLGIAEDSGPFAVGDDLFVDGAFFYQSTDITLPYVDGREPGCTWSGTPDASTSSRSANPQFLLFQGFIIDFDITQDKLNRTAGLFCVDRMGLWGQMRINQPHIVTKKSATFLHLLVDKVEGNLIAHPSLEWAGVAGAHPSTGWTGVGATRVPLQSSGVFAFLLEGDWAMGAATNNAAALEGLRYDATADIAATGKYRPTIWARAATSDVVVRFRFLRDAVVEKTVTFTLTSVYQILDMGEVDLSTLGTNRFIEVVTDVQTNLDFRVDALHVVKTMNKVERDFDDGQATLTFLAGYHDDALPLMNDVLESEPGIMFIKAGTLAAGDELAFRDQASRPAARIPRAVLGDGDGLMQFADGLAYRVNATDRISDVTVTSRGDPTIGDERMGVFGLTPIRDLTSGDVLKVRHQQNALDLMIIIKSAGGTLEFEDVHTALGTDIKVTGTATDFFFVTTGLPINFPSEWSVVEKTADIALPIQTRLTVQMPLQGNESDDMDGEAQRLIDKYKNRVIRLALPLNQRDDEVEALQLDVEINDLLIVRAENEAHSPGFDKKLYVEGIRHEWERNGAVIKTTLMLEEA